jgi:hypothetical protein
MAFVAQKTGIYTLSAQALHLNLDHSERELRAYELTSLRELLNDVKLA